MPLLRLQNSPTLLSSTTCDPKSLHANVHLRVGFLGEPNLG